MNEAHTSQRQPARRPDEQRASLFERIDEIVGSIRPAPRDARETTASSARANAQPAAAAQPQPAAAPNAPAAPRASAATGPVSLDGDPVFGRLLDKWFALERDRVLGEHLHLDQVQAVATAYENNPLRVMR